MHLLSTSHNVLEQDCTYFSSKFELEMKRRGEERRSDKETARDGKRKTEQRERKRTRERKNEGSGRQSLEGDRGGREGERGSTLRGSQSVLFDSLSKLGRRSETHS